MEKEDNIKLEEYRDVIAKLTADRETFRNIVEAHEKQDFERFQTAMKKLELPQRHCTIICWFMCWIECRIRCERICKIVCSPLSSK